MTRIPQLGRVIAGWNFAQGTQRMLCAPGSLEDRLGYAAETVVLLVTLKGGTGTVSLLTGGALRSWAQGGAALLAHAASVVTVRVPTQALAGTLAAVDSNGGMLVLLAEGNGGSGSGKRIALGIDDYLDRFTARIGGTSWKQLAKNNPANWESMFWELMSDKQNSIYFNLDGVEVWAGVQRAASGRGGMTDWELLMIRENKQWWNRITFMEGGVTVANPFQ